MVLCSRSAPSLHKDVGGGERNSYHRRMMDKFIDPPEGPSEKPQMGRRNPGRVERTPVKSERKTLGQSALQVGRCYLLAASSKFFAEIFASSTSGVVVSEATMQFRPLCLAV